MGFFKFLLFLFIFRREHLIGRVIPYNGNIILNLDDILNYYNYQKKTKNLVEIMTEILPLLRDYKMIEFAISEAKVNEIILPNNQLNFYPNEENKNPNPYHEFALRELKILGKKINVDFSIIYTDYNNCYKNYISLDHYISKMVSSNNNNNKKTTVIKNANTSLLKPYWNLSLPIKIIKIAKKESSLYSISRVNYDTNIPYLFTIEEFLG